MVDTVYLEIDGSLHEGGGQIIRSSMAFSNILQKPIKLSNIRVNRPNPGLNNQIMGAIKLMREITKAEVAGDKLKSLKISYEPQIKVKEGKYQGGSNSASAISLMVQSLIPTMIFGKGKSELKLQGGTDVNKSPPHETILRILKPLLQKMGVNFEYNLISEGYYPRGGGSIQLLIDPIIDYIQPITLLKRNIVNKIYLQYILTDNCKKAQKDYYRPLTNFMRYHHLAFQVKNRQQIVKQNDKYQLRNIFTLDFQYINYFLIKEKDITKFLMTQQEGMKEEDIEFDLDYKECYAIIAHAYGEDCYFAFSYYNDEDLEVENAANKVYENFVKELSDGGCLDEYHQDQLLLFMGLAKGESQIRVNPAITEHTQAGFYVLKQFLPDVKIDVIDEEIEGKKSKVIKIQGVGLKNE